MQATAKKANTKAARKGFPLQPILWTAGVILTVWYLTPAHWYAQPTQVRVDTTYRPGPAL